jgi:Concanavalin A-like lectin/glucanases superfamily
MSHYWKLDETAGSPYVDLSGNDNATCVNCPTPTTGIIGGAQLFNSASQVDAADDNTFDWGTGDSFSVEAWVKTDAGSTCSGNQIIVGRNDDASNLQWWIGCWDTTGEAAFVLAKSGTSAILSGTTALTDGQWHHIAAVRDAGTGEVSLYVDGAKEDSANVTYTGGFDSPTAALNIGWLNRAAGFHFSGAIDEVALYDRALSAVEILQHYTDGEAGTGYSYGLTVERISGGTTEYYSDPQTAYDSAADGDTLATQATLFSGELNFNQNAVTLRGGYDSAWIFHSDQYTTISGTMTISGGKVTVENLVIK